MSVDVSIELNHIHFGENISDIIQLFQQAGWQFRTPDNDVWYLPLGDKGEYNWTKNPVDDCTLFAILNAKMLANETVGLVMFWGNSEIGITLLVHEITSLVISPEINRQRLSCEGAFSETDANWYIEHIVTRLRRLGGEIESYRFEEYLC